MKKILTSIAIILLIHNLSFGQTLTDSLCAYYPFSGNANDLSGHGNNGTVHNATLTNDRYGNANSAYTFNGTNAYIDFLSNQKFKPTSFPITITAWVKSTGNNNAVIFENDNAPVTYSGARFQLNPSGVAHIYYGDGGTTTASYRRSYVGTTSVTDGQWHFIAGIIRGPTNMSIYVDCAFDVGGIYDGTGGTMQYTSNHGCAGQDQLGTGTYYYSGAIDEIRLYHRELSLSDLQHLYSYPTPLDGLSVAVPNDTTLCKPFTYTILSTATGTVLNYNWSTGSTTDTITVSLDGDYIVNVNNTCSYASDTIHVAFINCGDGISELNVNNVVINYVAENNSVLISNFPSIPDAKISLSLFDVIGQKIISEINISASENYEYKLSDKLPSGIYFARILIGNIPQTKMIVKNQ